MKATHALLTFALAVPAALHAQATTATAPPATTCRLTYTLTESDSGKKIGVQHFSITISPSSSRGTLKLGSKIPVVTGSYNPGSATGAAGTQTQFTYLDVGLNIDATLTVEPNGLLIVSKVEQSSVAEIATPQPSGPLRDEPVVRQAVLTNTALLTVGKPLVLGSLDTPGSTRHLDVEVVVEMVK